MFAKFNRYSEAYNISNTAGVAICRTLPIVDYKELLSLNSSSVYNNYIVAILIIISFLFILNSLKSGPGRTKQVPDWLRRFSG